MIYKQSLKTVSTLTAAMLITTVAVAQTKTNTASKSRQALVVCTPLTTSASTLVPVTTTNAAAAASAADPMNYTIRITAGPKQAQGNPSVWAANFYFVQTPAGRTAQAGHADISPLTGGPGSASASALLLDLKNTPQSPAAFELQVTSTLLTPAASTTTSTAGITTAKSSAGQHYAATLVSGSVFSGGLANISYDCFVSNKLTQAVTSK